MNIEIKEQNGSYLGILTGWIDTASTNCLTFGNRGWRYVE